VLLAGGGTYFFLRQRATNQAAVEAARLAGQAAAEANAQAEAQLQEQQALEAAAKLTAERTVTNDSVINLIAEKVPLQLILDHIRDAQDTQFDLSTTELIRLTKAKVPSVVIEQMRDPKRQIAIAVPAVKQAKAAPSAPPKSAPLPPLTPVSPAPTPNPVPIAAADSHLLAVTPAATPVATPVAAPVVPQTVTVQVPDAVPLRVTLAANIPADAVVGQPLRFTVAEDFHVDGTVVIRKGAAVYGEISEAAKKGKFFGIGAGKLSFTMTRADGVRSQSIKVRAAAARRADGPTQRPVDPGKGGSKDLAAAQGTEYIAYIDGAQTVSVPK